MEPAGTMTYCSAVGPLEICILMYANLHNFLFALNCRGDRNMDSWKKSSITRLISQARMSPAFHRLALVTIAVLLMFCTSGRRLAKLLFNTMQIKVLPEKIPLKKKFLFPHLHHCIPFSCDELLTEVASMICSMPCHLFLRFFFF